MMNWNTDMDAAPRDGTEFGHTGIIGAGFCIDSWGAGPFLIEVAGKRYTFEDSDRFGPLLLGNTGYPLDKQPGERHPFWKGYTPWLHQGRRVEEGLCIWQPFKPDKVRVTLRGRKRFVEMVEPGDDPFGAFEVVETLPSPPQDGRHE